MIEKYIENPEQNIPIKLELDKRSNLGTNKMEECLTQDLPRRMEKQDKVESNQDNQLHPYKEDMERSIKNGYYMEYFNGNMYIQNAYQDYIYNPYIYNAYISSDINNPYNAFNPNNANFNNQMCFQNSCYPPNQLPYQNNQNYINSQNCYIQNQNMMNMSQPIMPNMTNMNMNMNQIIGQNMMSLSADNLTNIIKPKITSLIRVLQCLYGCFEEIGPINKLSNFIKNSWYIYRNIQNSLTLDILDILSKASNPDNNFIYSVYNLRNKINAQTNIFPTNEETEPGLIFFYILKIINNEYKNNEIPYNNTIFSCLQAIGKIPQRYAPQIFTKIKQFEQKCSPCYSNFYYLLLEVIKCPRCNNILGINDNNFLFYNYLPLQGNFYNNVSNLIKYALTKENNNTFQYLICKCQMNRGYGKIEKAFLNTPNYLFINFEGNTKVGKYLDEKIDLTEYKLTNRGPNKYSLYAFIIKYNGQYFAFVKEGNLWVLYSDETTKMSTPCISFNCIPYCAIYKGMN